MWNEIIHSCTYSSLKLWPRGITAMAYLAKYLPTMTSPTVNKVIKRWNDVISSKEGVWNSRGRRIGRIVCFLESKLNPVEQVSPNRVRSEPNLSPVYRRKPAVFGSVTSFSASDGDSFYAPINLSHRRETEKSNTDNSNSNNKWNICLRIRTKMKARRFTLFYAGKNNIPSTLYMTRLKYCSSITWNS